MLHGDACAGVVGVGKIYFLFSMPGKLPNSNLLRWHMYMISAEMSAMEESDCL